LTLQVGESAHFQWLSDAHFVQFSDCDSHDSLSQRENLSKIQLNLMESPAAGGELAAACHDEL
jgi:hypothetical protein